MKTTLGDTRFRCVRNAYVSNLLEFDHALWISQMGGGVFTYMAVISALEAP